MKVGGITVSISHLAEQITFAEDYSFSGFDCRRTLGALTFPQF